MKNFKNIYCLLLLVLFSCSERANNNEHITHEIKDLYNFLNLKYTNNYTDFKKVKGHEVYKDVDRIKNLSDEILLDIDNKKINFSKIDKLMKEVRSYLPEDKHLTISEKYLNDHNYCLLIKTKLELYRLICLQEIIEFHKKSYFQCEYVGIRPVANKDSIKFGEVYYANLFPFFASKEITPSELIIDNKSLKFDTVKNCFIYTEKPSKKGIIEKEAEIIIERWGEIRKIPLVFKYYVK